MKKIILVIIVCLLAGFGAVTGANEGYHWARWYISDYYDEFTSRFRRVVEVKVPVVIDQESIPTIIKNAAKKYGLPKVLLAAMIEQESGGKFRTDRVRFEPHLQKRVKRESWMNDIEYQLRASSIGLMQVVVFIHQNNPECSSNIQELFQPDVNINCGASILHDCLLRHQSLPPVDRFRKALVCYNGGEDYPQEVFARIARLTIEGAL